MSQNKGRYIKFDALQKIRKRDGWKDPLNLIVGDQRDLNNYRVTDEVFVHILQEKGLLPEYTPVTPGDTISSISFNSDTSKFSIITDNGTHTVDLNQVIKVEDISERDGLISSVGEIELQGSIIYVRDSTGDPNDLSPTSFIYQGNGNWLNLGGSESTLEENVTSTVSVGAINSGETLATGTTFTEFVKQLLLKIYYPTLVSHYTTISVNVPAYQEIGNILLITITLNLNRGKIKGKNVGGVWDPNADQNFLTGPATAYEFLVNNNYPEHTSTNNSYDLPFEVQHGQNEIAGGVMYAEGPQPVDSLGNNYLSPEPGVPSHPPYEITHIYGVYAVYATTVNILTDTKQPLQSLNHNDTIELDLVGESGGNKQFFDIPDIFDTVSEVLIFNTVSNQYDPTNQLSTFTKAGAPNKTIHGNSVLFNRYTNNTANRGPTKIKIKF